MAFKLIHRFGFICLALLLFTRNYSNGELRAVKPLPSISHNAQKQPLLALDEPGIQHWAVYQSDPGKYYGVIANLTVHAHSLNRNQITAAEIWVLGGSDEVNNTLQAGWHVYPNFTGDSATRFFTYWTADDYKSTGCYDRICNGFVLDKNAIINPGSAIRKVTRSKLPVHYITIKIFKDNKSGDWWLYYGNDGNLGPIGYWPKSLFTTLTDSATEIHLGGSTVHLEGDVGPPMGRGSFPRAGNSPATFSEIRFINQDGSYSDAPLNIAFVDRNDCYRLGAFSKGMFAYGGPSTCTN